MQELSLPFPPPSAPSGSRPDPVSGGEPELPPVWSFSSGAESPDLLDPPFSAVTPLPAQPGGLPAQPGGTSDGTPSGEARGSRSLPWVPTAYITPIESVWYELHGGGNGFSPDDMECLHEWHQSGVPSELVVQVIREQPPSRARTGIHAFRRPRIYRLRYFHAEVMRRWKPPATCPAPAPPVPNQDRTRTSSRSSPRAGSRSGGRRPPSDASVGSPVPIPVSAALSPEKARFLRQELCVLLDTLATSLETAPRLWAARNGSLPQTSRVCLAGAESIRERIRLIETSHRVCILDLEDILITLDDAIWAALRSELPPSVVSDVMDTLAREDVAARRQSSRVSTNLIQLEREQRLRRWALECHHLPLELTVAGWWESVVVPAGGGASF